MPSLVGTFLIMLLHQNSIHAGGFDDTHDDGVLNGWKVAAGYWEETKYLGYKPFVIDQEGQIVGTYACTDDGTFETRVAVGSGSSSTNGGILCRWTSNKSFYYITLYAPGSGKGRIYLKKDTISTSNAVCIDSLLSFDSTKISLKLVLIKNTILFYLNNTFLKTYVDSVNPHISGAIGYGHVYTIASIPFQVFRTTWTDVPSKPEIKIEPVAVQIPKGGTASFSVVAMGENPLQYKWFFKKDALWEVLNAPDAPCYSIPVADTSKNGLYRAIVSNGNGSDTSTGVPLTVFHAVTITGEPKPDTVLLNSPVAFSVLAQGYPLEYQWYKKPGGGTWESIGGATNSTYSTLSGNGDTNAFFRCIVKAGASADTSAPVRFFLGSVPVVSPAFPAETALAKNKSIKLTAVAEGSPRPSYEWFLLPPLSNLPVSLLKDPVLHIANATKSDSARFFVVARNRLGWDSDTFFLHVLDGVSFKETLPVRYPIALGKKILLKTTAAGDGIIQYQWYKNTAPLNGGTDPALQIGAADSSFNNAIMECRAWNIFKTQTISKVNSNQCTIVISNYSNPFSVSASLLQPVSMKKIQIKIWSDVDTAEFPNTNPGVPWADSIRVYYKSNGYDTVGMSGSYRQSYSVVNLKKNWPMAITDTIAAPSFSGAHDSCYWFSSSIQWHEPDTLLKPFKTIKKINVLDSLAPLVVKADAVVEKICFNEAANTIDLVWTIDTTVIPGSITYEYAIVFNCGTALDTAQKPSKWTAVKNGKNSTSIDPLPSIVFDTTYVTGIWLRARNPANTVGPNKAPNQYNIRSVRTGSFRFQCVSMFLPGKDTVYVAGRNIALVKIQFPPEVYTDTIRRSDRVQPLPQGFCRVGALSFKFAKNPGVVTPFYLGVRYDSPQPPPFVKKVLLYHDAGKKVSSLDNCFTKNGYVWTAMDAQKMRYPLMALADTMKPSVTYTPYAEDIPPDTKDISTTFKIFDNCSNMRWKWLYGSGDGGFCGGDSGTIDSTERTVTVHADVTTIPSLRSGIRAFFIVSDGSFSDTCNVSRSIVLPATDTFATVPFAWIPLRSNAVLDTPGLAAVFNASFGGWSYDPYKYRIFRYCTSNPSDQGTNRYIEYHDTVNGMFSFDPGTLLWCKTSENKTIRFGKGVTNSLRKPFEITLKPEDWTDLCLPFRFPIMLQDVLDANDAVKNVIAFYHWSPDNTTYRADKLHVPFLDRDTIRRDTLQSTQNNDAYTVYNRSKQPIVLRIPPISLALSRYPGNGSISFSPGHRPGDDQWMLSFNWREHNAQQSAGNRKLFFAYRKTLEMPLLWGPLPPQMNDLFVGIHDSVTNALNGYVMQNRPLSRGTVFRVVLMNNAQSAVSVAYYLECVQEHLPEGMYACIFDPNAGAYIQGDSLHPTLGVIGAHDRTERYVVIGTREYLTEIVEAIKPIPFGITAVYPYPCHGWIRVFYTFPTGMKSITAALYTLSGRVIHRHTETVASARGTHSLVIKPGGTTAGIATGLYIIRISGTDTHGRTLAAGERKIVFIK